MFLNNDHISGTIQTDITGTNKPITLAQFNPIYPYKANGENKPKETTEQFLNKNNNSKCYKYLKTGSSLRTAANNAKVSLGTAQKIKKLMTDGII